VKIVLLPHYNSITAIIMLNFFMLKTILKLLFIAALCYWLIANGKIDFSLITQAIHSGYLWILGAFFLAIRFMVCAQRFKILLETKTAKPLSFIKVFSFDAIGNLFSVILPGSTTGDLVRFFYYKNLTEEVSPGMVGALLILDRLIGALALLALASITIIYLNPHFFWISLLSSVLIIVVSAVIILSSKRTFLFPRYLQKWPKLQKVLLDMLSIKLDLQTFIKCFILSVLNYLLIICGFWLLAYPFISEKISFIAFASIIPLGFAGLAIPIAPSGLGVGHVLFENLFKFIQLDNGASLFNLFFVANVFICLLGVIPYLYYKK
jgi:uncharacterized membrane protein YbhN (UPF0104 family)